MKALCIVVVHNQLIDFNYWYMWCYCFCCRELEEGIIEVYVLYISQMKIWNFVWSKNCVAVSCVVGLTLSFFL